MPSEESGNRAADSETHVVRLKAPTPWPDVDDLVYGRVKSRSKFPSGTLNAEDAVILKSDGLPTYHLSNVVDDHYMKITHVVRANEWLSSTPKHLAMYHAFGWEPPAYAHISLLVDHTGNKLSKRNQDVSLAAYRRQGFFPEALLNHAALLGWRHNLGSDVMSLQQLVSTFDMTFTRGTATADHALQSKLHFLQKSHIGLVLKEQGPAFEEIVDLVEKAVVAKYQSSVQFKDILGGRDVRGYVKSVVLADGNNYIAPSNFVDRTDYFYHEPDIKFGLEQYAFAVRAAGISYASIKQDILAAVKQIEQTAVEDWNVPHLTEKLSKILSAWGRNGVKVIDQKKKGASEKPFPAFHYYLRCVIAEGMNCPANGEIMALLGRDITLRRLRRAAQLADVLKPGAGESVQQEGAS